MSMQEFDSLMGDVAQSFEGRPVDDAMAKHLNATCPARTTTQRSRKEMLMYFTFCRTGRSCLQGNRSVGRTPGEEIAP